MNIIIQIADNEGNNVSKQMNLKMFQKAISR